MVWKRQYEIINNSKDPVRAITMEGHEVRIPPRGMTTVSDEGLAKEIDAEFGYRARTRNGGKVVVVPVDDRDRSKAKGYPTYHRLPRALTYKTIAERDAARRQEG